ncbi:MAG TPA: hypothetical protein VD947_03155 [Patescibacteria group bacterium]|nr:hypothetical protein [Patescibacteria group bacterium]
MSPILVGLFAGVGVSAWVYNKAMRNTGNNTKNSLTLAGVCGVISFIIVLTLLSLVDSALSN